MLCGVFYSIRDRLVHAISPRHCRLTYRILFHMSKSHALSDLKSLGKEMKAIAKAREEERARKEAERAAARQNAALFEKAMSDLGVSRLQAKYKRVEHRLTPAKPIVRRRQIEKQEILDDLLSDGCDPFVFLESDDGMFFRRQGVSPDIPRKLYRGEWTVQGRIDLHGLFVDEARDAVANFLRESRIRGHRCLHIVHGKGYGSVGGQSILKELVRRWLKQCDEVMAFVQAPPNDGDSGAVIVLLKPFLH